jgi:5-methylcytosine-specific restriction enzyme subunit McrC
MTLSLIEVHEHSPREFARDELDAGFANAVWSRYRQYVDVDFPTPKTSDRWRLTAKGCVGFLPVDDRYGLVLQPKVPVANLFRMLEYAYGLDSFRFLEGAFTCASLEEFYAFLAGELAARVLRRVRQGLQRGYGEREERLPFLRGRFDAADHARHPWMPELRCRFDQHTIDTEDNRLIAWAVFLAARTVFGPQETRALVMRAHRALHGSVQLVEARSSACVNRTYDRLNSDYAAMHALSAFVIDHAGPQHARGDRNMLPFVVDMNRLFERFVSRVLSKRAGTERSVVAQERVQPAGDTVTFVLDILVRDAHGRPLRVVDTKYKNAKSPSTDDVAQVVAYATALRTTEAVLVYPSPVDWTAQIGPVRVRTLGVRLDENLDVAADVLAQELLCPVTRRGR